MLTRLWWDLGDDKKTVEMFPLYNIREPENVNLAKQAKEKVPTPWSPRITVMWFDEYGDSIFR